MITPPVSSGTVTAITVSRTVDTAFKSTQLKIGFTLENSLSSDEFILLQFPQGMAFKSSSTTFQVKRYSDATFSSLTRTLATN